VEMLRLSAQRIKARRDELNRLDLWPWPSFAAGDRISHSLEAAVDSLPTERSLAKAADSARRALLLNSHGHQSMQITAWFSAIWQWGRDHDPIEVQDLPGLFRLAARQAASSMYQPEPGDLWQAADGIALRAHQSVEEGLDLAAVFAMAAAVGAKFLNESRRLSPYLASVAGRDSPALPTVLAFAELLAACASVVDGKESEVPSPLFIAGAGWIPGGRV
jgi:dihydroxyacetone kinase-like predicted kinase